MSLNDTPVSERTHIGFFGRRNAGKSSLVNAVTGQEMAVVSDVKGTTTDYVTKTMELLPLGPVVIIDTPGFDDEGTLGELRIQRTKQVLNRADLAVLVLDATVGVGNCEKELIEIFQEKEIPYLMVWNKSDLLEKIPEEKDTEIYVSAKEKRMIYELKDKIASLAKGTKEEPILVRDLVSEKDQVILVIPIDKAAPKGRLILPQQMMIRDLLDADAIPVCVKEHQLEGLLEEMGEKRPALVITDSQVFGKVSKIVPEDIPLTSFSILMARYKGFLDEALKGCRAIDDLKDQDKVLIAEGCTHHRQCGDIGSEKLPAWLKEHTGKELQIELTSGKQYPQDLSSYALVIQCGGCMLNEREVRYRMQCAVDQNVPFTNYGTAIAHMKGILKRSVEVLKK